ncbi:queuine tRNA-ribosyltransferase accessory subunit 2-like isoform X2 [Varroa destructor]|uniref:tRNA-guanine(15) transglycosylase-like domain-containing protein n=1 Tax=Varroa destructor TaxID=109461 RepID=A0A7M7M6G4_VARDE|nr:queuine tRNA-ribosyltransferase accessory subunit 2-like isoform X2 [Varroa destructor]
MESMKFSLSRGTPSRLGSLVFGDIAIPTPAMLLYTQAGSVPHLTVDNVERIIDQPYPLVVPLQSTYSMHKSVAALGKGISKFAGFSERCPSVQIIQDPLKETQKGFNNRQGVCIFEDGGKIQLTPKSITEAAAVFRPAAYQALTDGDTPKGCSNKRLSHSVKRSTDYLDSCIRTKEEQMVQSGLLASIQGGYNEVSRRFSVSDAMKRDQNKIAGYILDGFHMNGEKTAELEFSSIASLITVVIEGLPENKPRFMFGCYNPEMIIELARSGVDCFDSSYACLQTDKNRALLFSFEEVRNVTGQARYLQLDDVDKYRSDMGVIVGHCRCYTCNEGFSRAYINHLLLTKELLGILIKVFADPCRTII